MVTDSALSPTKPARTGAAAEPAAAPDFSPSPAYRRYVLWLLLLVYIVNFIDRNIVYILIEPIKIELRLLDWQLGLLSGVAFGLVYTGLSFPLAVMADRRNRAILIGACLAVWSGFTALCGLAQSFAQLLIARAGVGVGEAGCVPSAHALITDYTPREQRASALAFFSLGAPIGSTLGLLLGGLMTDYFGWRTAFLVAAAPGFVLAVLITATVREPRSRPAAAIAPRANGPTLSATLRHVMRKPAFWRMGVAAGIRAFLGYGQGPFFASFIYRVHGPDLTALALGWGLRDATFVGLLVGVLSGVGGVLGTMVGGWVCDRHAARDARVLAAVPAAAALIATPLMVAQFLVPSVTWVLVFVFLSNLFATVWFAPVYSAAQSMVPAEMRAKSSAIMIFMINFIGLVFGALLVGGLSDFLSVVVGLGAAEGMRWSLIVSTLAGLAAAPLFWGARRTIRRDVES